MFENLLTFSPSFRDYKQVHFAPTSPFTLITALLILSLSFLPKLRKNKPESEEII